jgi:hypothetical protein
MLRMKLERFDIIGRYSNVENQVTQRIASMKAQILLRCTEMFEIWPAYVEKLIQNALLLLFPENSCQY